MIFPLPIGTKSSPKVFVLIFKSASLIDSVPSTGIGTVAPQNGYADQIFPACGL